MSSVGRRSVRAHVPSSTLVVLVGCSVAWAEFEEKEFEVPATVELASGCGVVLPPGQVLEHLVGYDVAADPVANHRIWRILSVPRPAGVRLVPDMWERAAAPSASALPRIPLSLFVQYKRPEFLRGPRAAQRRHWNRPYFRITRAASQHRVLLRLERRLGDAALVRYAAPAFWQRHELEVAHLRRSVLAQTGFVAPSAIGTPRVDVCRSRDRWPSKSQRTGTAV